VAAIVAELLRGGDGAIVLTRADEAQVDAAMAIAPDGRLSGGQPATVVWRHTPGRPERVLVVTAGTADLPVADECVATLEAHGFAPVRLADVGVAGLHRLLAAVDELAEADAVVVVAGMEGALASVVAGLTAAPVIAVPTSTGYGAGLEGVTALLGMLASCASGLTVVGIDNGFGAASAVVRLLPAPVRSPR
jgi:NCAIR mutase (PurE)-related protein